MEIILSLRSAPDNSEKSDLGNCGKHVQIDKNGQRSGIVTCPLTGKGIVVASGVCQEAGCEFYQVLKPSN